MCNNCSNNPMIKDDIPIFSPDLLNKSEFMPSNNYKKLQEWEEKGFWWFFVRRKIIKHLFKKYISNAKNCCEVGCGGGYILQGIKNENPILKCYGTEVHLQGLKIAQKRLPGSTFFQSDLLNFPYVNKFDAIGAFDVLEHIEDDDLALKNIFNALKDKGGLILTVPQHNWLWTEKDKYSGHKRRYNKKKLVAKLEKNGFKIIRTTSYTSLLLPIMLFSRLKDKNNKNIENEIIREFEISNFTNRILSTISNIEYLLIKVGINFPVGGSLFIICQKK